MATGSMDLSKYASVTPIKDTPKPTSIPKEKPKACQYSRFGDCRHGSECRQVHSESSPSQGNVFLQGAQELDTNSPAAREGERAMSSPPAFVLPPQPTDIYQDKPAMAQTYTDAALRSIGERCETRLPPASAVQAMFLYEMQRQSEVESLFRAQMFQLSAGQDHAAVHESQLGQISEEIAALKKQLASRDVEDRLATSKTRFDVLQTKIKQQDDRIISQNEQLARVEKQQEVEGKNLKDLAQQLTEQVDLTKSADAQQRVDTIRDREKFDKLSSAVSLIVEKLKSMQTTSNNHSDQLQTCMTDTAEIIILKADVDGLKALTGTCDNDVGVLFDERDALAAQLQQAVDRISKLEDLVRALTGQHSPTSSNGSSPTPFQIIPVQTNDGQPLELRVPKGHPFQSSSAPPNAKKENAPPLKGRVQSFFPDQQSWSGS